MIPRRAIKPFAEHLEAAGVKLIDVSATGSAHYKLLVTFKGNRRFFIISNSSSDRRAFLNWKSDVRKWIKEIKNGVLDRAVDHRAGWAT